ncbi:hypothetical protein DEU56DRAFT_889108 [Suillus clintonianus]|uniref:uncharacterized protein n=1 Tax=Suillus clintonianus TaxID=1904413 RepID=UPI001B872ABE|nr:uncharacterized protein DEU56DRAFT_889108 [Suillus clintonianus]KAG2132763.1 hypothetical protein DEU56DRAFT_889108 [Suillus clintonianus]
MSHIGSVFLGDFQRFRILSSTPPSSPPPGQLGHQMSVASASQSLEELVEHHDNVQSELSAQQPTAASVVTPLPQLEPSTAPPVIDPVLSLELRLRWLEALLLGVRQDARDRKGKEKVGPELKHGETLIRLAENVQRRLDSVIQSNDSLQRFMSKYDLHAHLLTAAFALSGVLPGPAPTYENMSPEELEALLVEMEPEIRAADRDMREIEMLEHKGVTAAGKLADYETLQPRLDALLKAHQEDIRLAASLEKRIAVLVDRHATHVDALSELFVAWDDVLTETENKVTKLERDRDERQRLGYV